jgi:hypothetical protein
MPQGLVGNSKVGAGKHKKSAVSQQRTLQKQKTVIKRNNSHSKHTKVEVTKKINKNIESAVAAKALSAGTQFRFKDLKERGEHTVKRQLALRNKKQLVNKRRTMGSDGQFAKK